MIELFKVGDRLIGPTGREANVVNFREYGRRGFSMARQGTLCNSCGGRIAHQVNRITTRPVGKHIGFVCSTPGRRGRQTYCSECVVIKTALLVDDQRTLPNAESVDNFDTACDLIRRQQWDTLYLDYDLCDYAQRTGLDLINWLIRQVNEGNSKIVPREIIPVVNNVIIKRSMEESIAQLYRNIEALAPAPVLFDPNEMEPETIERETIRFVSLDDPQARVENVSDGNNSFWLSVSELLENDPVNYDGSSIFDNEY